METLVVDELTFFASMSHFYTPWKRFSEGIEMEHWREKG